MQDYFKNGYQSSLLQGSLNNQARTIGFVMTVYRKLAASSIAAIHVALQRRLHKLKNYTIEIKDNFIEDERFSGEEEENQLWKESQTSHEFFAGEIAILEKLCLQSKQLLTHDLKCQTLIQKIIPSVLQENPTEKLLIFTEYKTTQSYLQEEISQYYGMETIGLIHGSMTHQQRSQVIEQFEQGNIQFLISTEAGGEGINLQRHCHIMVNYDLPWNPMRLVQRIGRLYRYGQQKNVIIFNIHAPDTADAQIVLLMYERINQVVNDMAHVSSEFNERLRDDIFGELAQLADIQDILNQANHHNRQQTRQQIDAALSRARDALSLQRELFEHAASFSSQENQQYFPLSHEHWRAFVLGMFDYFEIHYHNIHNDKTWDIKLPEKLAIGRKTHLRVSIDRLTAQLFKNIEVLDLNHSLMRLFLATAKSYEFQGDCALIHSSDDGIFACNIMRWQNSQGQRRQQEWVVLQMTTNGNVNINPTVFCEWLKNPCEIIDLNINDDCHDDTKTIMTILDKQIENLLAQKSNLFLFPENHQWLTIGKCI